MLLSTDSWEHSQDITTDGSHYYFSCKYGLIKTELDCKTVVARNADAIPDDFFNDLGVTHIGGISYFDGKIYCAAEDSKVWKHPMVLVYDAKTLDYTGISYELDPERHTRGLPWVAVDPDTGIIYCSSRDHSTEIMRYDPSTRTYLESIQLVNDSPEFDIHKIQGGDIAGGTLFLATNDDTQSVCSVELSTGRAVKLFDRNLFSGSEGEGLTVLKTADGAFLHCMDMSPIFISSYVRHFAATGE